MPFQVAVLQETRPLERRTAMVPSVASQLAALGGEVHFNPTPAAIAAADLVLGVQAPSLATARALKPGAILISFIHAQLEPELVATLRDREVTCFAMELVPRISRAQAMDALSSQAALSGYYSALLAATHLPRIVPRMTTATGAVRPATALVMGLGVAGLQAIATLRRLGAVIEGYDVRPETKEEAESLGAKFVATGVDARGQGGYARELTSEEKEKVNAVLTQHIQSADIVITAASVPGRRAPRLISRSQVEGMKADAVIVDLGAEGGGNCEATTPGETTRVGRVTIVAPLNVPSLLAEHASELYAKNILNLLKLMVAGQALKLDWSDEVLAKTALTHAGEIKNDAARQLVAASSGAAAPRQVNRMQTTVVGFVALYIFMLAAFTGLEIIGRVPAILHTPLMSGSNFVHGIVVVGALYALLNSTTPTQQAIGFLGVLLGAGNAAGGYVVTKRMLEMFKPSGSRKA